jgi:predicted HicB family RNase H-like nuclease
MGFTPVKNEKINATIRIEIEKLELIDNLAYKSDISRNQFIIQCIDFALKHLSE